MKSMSSRRGRGSKKYSGHSILTSIFWIILMFLVDCAHVFWIWCVFGNWILSNFKRIYFIKQPKICFSKGNTNGGLIILGFFVSNISDRTLIASPPYRRLSTEVKTLENEHEQLKSKAIALEARHENTTKTLHEQEERAECRSQYDKMIFWWSHVRSKKAYYMYRLDGIYSS